MAFRFFPVIKITRAISPADRQRSGVTMSVKTRSRRLSWWPAITPYIAAATFPIACLQYISSQFASSGRELHAMILIGWLVLAICSIAGIGISLQRGSKLQQLVALLSIPPLFH